MGERERECRRRGDRNPTQQQGNGQDWETGSQRWGLWGKVALRGLRIVCSFEEIAFREVMWWFCAVWKE